MYIVFALLRILKMETTLSKEKKNVIKTAEEYCSEAGLKIELVYDLPEDILEAVSKRSEALPSLYFVTVEMLRSRLKNGCFLIKKGNQICGHIFAHRHTVQEHSVYERSSLWVDPEYRNCNLGLLLMCRMTELYTKDFLISIAQTSKVHHYNELLGMTHVTLAEMSTVLVEELEKIGKLRDELKYKYFVNPYFESEIRELK